MTSGPDYGNAFYTLMANELQISQMAAAGLQSERLNLGKKGIFEPFIVFKSTGGTFCVSPAEELKASLL